MADQTAPIIVTLTVHKGNKPGSMVATYTPERRKNCIVFLKSVVEEDDGKNYRFQLRQMMKADKAGNWMYEGFPASDIIAEVWKDNGDGTVSKVQTSEDWKGNVRDVKILEPARPKAKKDGDPQQRQNLELVLGADLASSKIVAKLFHHIPQYVEGVSGGQLVWASDGSRTESVGTQDLPIGNFTVKGFTHTIIRGKLQVSANLDPVYESDWKLSLRAETVPGEVSGTVYLETEWGKLPKWAQTLQEAEYPICICGRSRVQKQSDGYAKCELCRSEEICDWCGKDPVKISLVDGKRICDECKPFAEAAERVNKRILQEKREEIANLAKALLTVDPMDEATGKMVLSAILSHLKDRPDPWKEGTEWAQAVEEWGSTQERIIKRLTNQSENEVGYPYYYFTSQGVYGSKFSPNALLVLQFYNVAQKRGLVESSAWLEGDHETRQMGSDYYWQSQVEGKDAGWSLFDSNLPGLTLAVKLCGSLAQRDEAIGLLTQMVKKLGANHPSTKSVAKEIFESETQDYGKAADIARKTLEDLAQREAAMARGEIWLNVRIRISTQSRTSTKVFAIAADGSIIEPLYEKDGVGRKTRTDMAVYGDLPSSVLVISHEDDNYGYQYSERWEIYNLPKEVTAAQKETVKRLTDETRVYFSGKGTGWGLSKAGLVSINTCYSRDLSGSDREAYDEMCQHFPIDVSQYEMEIGESGGLIVGPYRLRDPKTVRNAALQKQLDDLRMELHGLEMAWEENQKDFQVAEEAALVRMDAEYGKSPVANNDVFEVVFHEEDRQGQKQLVTDPIFDEPSASWVKLILDPFQSVIPAVGEKCLVRVRAKNSQQIHLFSYQIPNPEGNKGRGGRMVFVKGYFAKPVYGERDYQQEIAKLQAEIAEVEGQLAGNIPITPDTKMKVEAVEPEAPEISEEREVGIEKDPSQMTAMEFALWKAQHRKR